MDFQELKKGDIVIVRAKDHFSFDSEIKTSEILEDRDVRGTFGWEVVGWVEAQDEDYIYIRFIRPLPRGFTPRMLTDGGMAILKAVIEKIEKLEVGK